MYWGSGSFHFVYPVIVTARGMHLCSRPIRQRMASLLSRARRKVALAPGSHRSRRASEQEREDQDAALSHDSRRFGAQRGRRAVPGTGWGLATSGTSLKSHSPQVRKLEVIREKLVSLAPSPHSPTHLVLSWSC